MLPDRYIEHGSQKDQIEAAGLSSRHIATTVLSLLGEHRDDLHILNFDLDQYHRQY
jgi:1-deoxy-D-xylulose-5-phosphate synthase